MIPPWPSEEDRGTWLRERLAAEMLAVVLDLEQREHLLLEVWSAHRDRGPFFDTLATGWSAIGFDDLLLLDLEEYRTVRAFHRLLDAFRMYATWTEDMPATMAAKLGETRVELRQLADAAVTALGVVPEPVADGIQFDEGVWD